MTTLAEAVEETHNFLLNMDFWLITVPTIALAVVTIWANDRLYQIAKQALAVLGQKIARKKDTPSTLGEPSFHSHELTALDNVIHDPKNAGVLSDIREVDVEKLKQKQ